MTRVGLWGWAAGAWAGLILVLCLLPYGDELPKGLEICLICGDRGAGDFVLNVLLYAPLGFAIGLRTRSVTAGLLVGFILSFGVEMAQLRVPGRLATVGDLVANGAGASLGALVAHNPARWLFPDRLMASRLTRLWALGAVLASVLPGLLASPSVPGGPLYGNWTPDLDALPSYEGRLLAASIGGISLPSRRLDDPARIRALLEAGVAIELRLEVGSIRDRGPATLFRLIGGREREALRIDISGSDVIVTPRYLATDLWLARPRLRFSSALGGAAPGDTVSLAVRPASGGYELMVDGNPPVHQGLSTVRGWAMLGHGGGSPRLLFVAADLFWMAMLLIPIGWWAPSRSLLMGTGAVPLAMLAITPLWSPLVPPHPLYYLAGVVLLLAGFRARPKG